MIGCVYRFQFDDRLLQGFLVFNEKHDREFLLSLAPKAPIAFRLLNHLVLGSAFDLEIDRSVFKSGDSVWNDPF